MADQATQAGMAEQAKIAEATPVAKESAPASGDVLDKFTPPPKEQLRGQNTAKPETLAEPIEKAPEPLLAGKYKTQEDLITGYINLQKKIGDFSGAPDKYSLDKVNKETQYKFVEDDKYLQQFMDMAKKHNMSQDMFEQTLDLYRTFVVDMMPKPEKEMERLGADAPVKVRGLKMWADEHLSSEGKKRFKKYVGDAISEADLFLLLDEMRGATSPTEGPTHLESIKSAQQSIAEIQQEIADNLKRYESDPLYRQAKRQQLQEAFDYKKKYQK